MSVVKPDGPGPFPAIVMLHDCSGLGPASSGAPRRWAGTLVERSYVIVMPDSFSTRGYPNGVCTDASRGRVDVSPLRRSQDAFAALEFARSLPYVDARRIAVMGGSHGGSTTLATLVRGGFVAGIALYPRCSLFAQEYKPSAPLLILIGEKDDWTPAEPCRKLADGAGPSVSLKIYPGAHHSFDSTSPIRYVKARINSSAPDGRGATTGGNPEAWADSIQQVSDFFGHHLK